MENILFSYYCNSIGISIVTSIGIGIDSSVGIGTGISIGMLIVIIIVRRLVIVIVISIELFKCGTFYLVYFLHNITVA